ncbi:hypothetical protein [Parachlamydia sp. AcF125]|uniref:hypothetical protein n=1 Tax=Parachlamydia sp. AcF125 TaxID=2795736 RepID=UPI001BC91598|nr:hypothetical protein [Parachlamydia sp. AcF125]MBS4167747.1 hypothetical protein [Parachlamydia sp. AcF125]
MHYFKLFPILLLLLLPCCVKLKKTNLPKPLYEREYKAGGKTSTEDISRTIMLYAQDLRKKYKHLILEDSQVIFSNRKLNRIQLKFTTQHAIEVREARELLVEVVEDFLYLFNGQYALVAQAGGELNPEKLDIAVNFESYEGVFIDPFYVGFMTLHKGLVSFYAFDYKDVRRDDWHKRVEYYWQSRNIVKFEQEYLDREDKQKEKAYLLDNDRFRISSKRAGQGTTQAAPYNVFQRNEVPEAVVPMGHQVPMLKTEIFDLSSGKRPLKAEIQP